MTLTKSKRDTKGDIKIIMKYMDNYEAVLRFPSPKCLDPRI